MNEHYFYPSELMGHTTTYVPQDRSRNFSNSQQLEKLRDALQELVDKNEWNYPCQEALKNFISILDRRTASSKEGRIEVVEKLKDVWRLIKYSKEELTRHNQNKFDEKHRGSQKTIVAGTRG